MHVFERSQHGSELSGEDARALIAVLQDLATLRELEDLTALVRRAARSLTGAQGITFVLREGDQVHYVDEDAITPLWKGQRFPIDACVSGWVVRHRTAATIPDIALDARVPFEAYAPTFVRSMAMVPIRQADPIGAIGAYWAERHVATERELSLLATLANAAAVALDNLRLFNLEKEARRAAETEAQLRTDLLAIVSHDLRSPLSSIALSTSLLAPLVAPLNGRARHHVDLIARSTRRLDALIHDLIDFASVEGGQLRLDRRPVTVREVLSQVADFVPLAAERGVTLDFDAGDDEQIHADLDRLHQVFSNLIGNSLRHSTHGSRISVSARRDQNHVAFSVLDTGPGFPEELLPRLWERKGRPRGVLAGGLGLGLSITKGIVGAHGGTIHAENAETGGAAVTFRLPTIA